MYGENDMKLIRNGDPKTLLIMENCVKNGKKLMIEAMQESTDPILEPILLD
jgi:hypothetical protein